MEECDGSVPVTARVVALQGLVRSVLDGKNASEWLATEERRQTRRLIGRVRRIGEHHIELTARQALGKFECIAAMYRDGILNTQGANVLSECLERGGIQFDEGRR